MPSTAGKIYDKNEVERIQGWIDQQTNAFIDSEKSVSERQWLLSGGIVVVSVVILLLVAKRIM